MFICFLHVKATPYIFATHHKVLVTCLAADQEARTAAAPHAHSTATCKSNRCACNFGHFAITHTAGVGYASLPAGLTGVGTQPTWWRRLTGKANRPAAPLGTFSFL